MDLFFLIRQSFEADFVLGIKQDTSLCYWQNAITGINIKRTPKEGIIDRWINLNC